MTNSALASAIDARCRLHGEFTLRSGQVADEYFDKYLFEGDPQLIRRVAEEMQPLLPADTLVLGGLELGGVPIAAVLGQIADLPTVFVRKKAKGYGTRKLAEGGAVEGRHVVLVEDVITTGGAVIAAANALRELGARVELVVCAIDRRPPEATGLDDAAIEVRSVFTRADLDTARAAHR
ncbi:orotate phosphoribosyltransferase [Flexivirga endophytica]|uniref:Orotate phosphoribosyltransferase n=1 Tax=Flexivirga endophytica TaxID=1849103 RepID=A0A916TJL2_9MICO|nr:orotate phosphoribosyltransferase [Flexivirga endophytica]GGB48130.1 orotate phosphoribosyltransferase [Flexivirga endophytica]GHB61072.1 orotate phosphoribosyltransferase [Flexivirga endophytica]